MKVLLNLSLARIRHSPQRHIYPAVSVFVSMALLSFISIFLLETTTFINAKSSFAPDTVVDFIKGRVYPVLVAIAVVIIITLVFSLFVHSGTQREEKRQLLAVLTSIGATSIQKKAVLLFEAVILHFLPVLFGSLCGALPARYVAEKLIKGFSVEKLEALPIELLIIVVGFVFLFGISLISCCSLILLEKRRDSVISTVKRFNKRESEAKHTYRKSSTFKNMSVTKRLAQKSIDYHITAIVRIISMFVITALYPALFIFFFQKLAADSIVIDNNPYDGIDTSAITISAIENVITFFLFAFLILFAVGVLQLFNLIKAHGKLRQEQFTTYTSIGMTEEQFNEVIKHERKSIIARSLVALIVIIAVILTTMAGMK